MALPTRPFLVLYIAWHPLFNDGETIAKKLFHHYRRELFNNVAGGAGLSVVYRSEPAEHSIAPLPIELTDGETAAVIVLGDAHWVGDPAYRAWLNQTSELTEAAGLSSRLIPVDMDGHLIAAGIQEQAIPWNRWVGINHEGRVRRMVTDVSYQLARMLRTYLESLKHPAANEDELSRYLRKIQVFLSHSKRDNDGERIARHIRQALFDGEGLATFFDVHDIPAGVKFDKVILNQIRTSAVVAIHTDTFSSREWCRREIIEAKRAQVPLVIANCISDADERCFPYMGNVPVIRMDPGKVDRIEDVVGRLIDEVLKDFLWRCRIELVRAYSGPAVSFLPRVPELISLVGLDLGSKGSQVLVYPDPPLGAEEQRLFEAIAPALVLRSMTEWVAEVEASA